MENTENGGMGMGMGPSNAMWGNMNWGNTPFWGGGFPGYGYGRGGAGGVATAGLITGIIGSVLGLATGGFGLAGMGRNGWGNGYGPNGGQNLYDQVQALSAELSSVKADVAVNTQRDVDLAEQTKLQIEIAKKDAEIKTLESERRIDREIDNLRVGIVNNAGTIKCVQDNLNSLTQIGIPSANIITPPTGAATTSTAGA